MASVRGTTAVGTAYTTSETDIFSFQCNRNIRSGVFFSIYPTTAGTAKVYYKDPGGTFREHTSISCAANDLTWIHFPYPISETKMTYQATATGGTLNAEGRGY